VPYIPAPPLASACWIGNFAFLDLIGPPAAVSNHGVPVHRPGRDTAVWFPGTFARDFPLVSHVDAFTLQYASELFQLYRNAVGSAVDLAYHGIVWTNPDLRCIIRDVDLVKPNGLQRLAFGVGGLCPPSLAFLRCKWELSLVTKDS
jgi:hypothetical protein